MPDGILPVALACHDMKVSEVKLEFVIDTMILVSLKDRGGKGGRLQRWYINFGNWVNQIDVAYFVDCAGSRQTMFHKKEILGNNSKFVFWVYWGL